MKIRFPGTAESESLMAKIAIKDHKRQQNHSFHSGLRDYTAPVGLFPMAVEPQKLLD
jgi:hypothetical protein